MDFPSNFRISPGIPTGPADLFLPIFDNHFLIIKIIKTKITLVLIMNVSLELANCTFGILRSQQKTDTK
jgi:hypothetical protein